MLAKMATLERLKNIFWNKGYFFIISAYGITNKILSCDSNFIVNVVKFGNSSTSMREVIATSIL